MSNNLEVDINVKDLELVQEFIELFNESYRLDVTCINFTDKEIKNDIFYEKKLNFINKFKVFETKFGAEFFNRSEDEH